MIFLHKERPVTIWSATSGIDSLRMLYRASGYEIDPVGNGFWRVGVQPVFWIGKRAPFGRPLRVVTPAGLGPPVQRGFHLRVSTNGPALIDFAIGSKKDLIG